MPVRLLIALGLLALTGCADIDTFEDAGNALVVSQGGTFDAQEVTFEDGFRIDVLVRSGIHATGCDDFDATCEIAVDVDQITITAMFERSRPPMRCRAKDDGQSMVATCTSAPIPEGIYSVHYGDETAELQIPSTIPPLQVGPDVPEP